MISSVDDDVRSHNFGDISILAHKISMIVFLILLSMVVFTIESTIHTSSRSCSLIKMISSSSYILTLQSMRENNILK